MKRSKRGWSAPALVLLLMIVLPLLLVRISLESSLWCDEIYSIQMAGMPVSEMIDNTLIDFHPPGYYLALRGWLALGRWIGLEPGVFWGRLPGVLGWIGLVAGAWLLGRRVFGRHGTVLIAVCAGIAAQTGGAVKDMRSYALAYPALFICFVVLLAMRSRKQQTLGWMLYAACASVALWTHMLAGPVLGLLAIMWITTGLGLSGSRRKTFLIQGFVAQAAALISFLPWLPLLNSVTIGHLDDHRVWMTPPTVRNWLQVFVLWYPLGRHGGEEIGGVKFAWQASLGVMTVAVPLAGWTWGRLGRNRRVPRIWKLLAAWGIALAFANVTLLWALDRWDVVAVFHGPRYTLFTAAMWIAGLAGLSQCARIKAGWRPWSAWALMTPLLICSAAGMAFDLNAEIEHNIIENAVRGANPMPAPGEPLYVIPSELIPYQRRTLARWDARPIEDIAGIPREIDHVSILSMNTWLALATERDMVVQSLLYKGRLAQSVTQHLMPPHAPHLDYFSLLEARGWNHELAKQLGRDGFRAKIPPMPSNAVARIDAKMLRMRDGWHIMQPDDDLHRYRWSSAVRTRVPLPALDAGRYTLHFSGARWIHFTGMTRLAIRPPGQERFETKEIGPHSFDVAIPFELAGPERGPVVLIEHPLMNVNAGKPDPAWWTGIAFYRLWIERQ